MARSARDDAASSVAAAIAVAKVFVIRILLDVCSKKAMPPTKAKLSGIAQT